MRDESEDSLPAKGVERRRFVKGTVTGGFAAGAGVLSAASPASAGEPEQSAAAPVPSAHELDMEEGDVFSVDGYTQEQTKQYFVERPGSDIIVDIIRSVGLPYMALNPASSFRGLQESIVNYADNDNPQVISCTHEEQATAIAHGFAKVSGKPMGVLAHGTVGIQHAAMAVYNAYVDRVPMVLFGSTHASAVTRASHIDWMHSAHDTGRIIRDFTKWDAAPLTLQDFAESFSRAMTIAMTPPMGPVYLALDADLQEREAAHESVRIPTFVPAQPPVGDGGALKEVAQLLVAAEKPVIVADRLATTSAGMSRLVELAETLQIPVVDKFGRMNFPSSHHLNQTFGGGSVIADADVILALEVSDVWGLIHSIDRRDHSVRRKISESAKVVTIGSGGLYVKANYQSFQRFYAADIVISGDGEATLPLLIAQVRDAITAGRRRENSQRGEHWRNKFVKTRRQAVEDARYGWDASPVSMARLSMELWEKIRRREWTLTPRGGAVFQSAWPQRLWDFEHHYNHIGDSGAAGLGYGAPASVGAALANRDQGRLTVNIQGDGDFLYVPGAFWTAAHHRLPLLTVMHNNGGYHQEVMHLQRMASARRRGMSGRTARIGNALDDPRPDYAAVAKGLGVWSTGPISNPSDLAPALDRALDVIDQGEPALIDLLCQPR